MENNSDSIELEDEPPNILKNSVVDGIERALVILRNPNLPINRLLRHSMHRFNQFQAKVRKKFVSRSLCIACVYLQVNNNSDEPNFAQGNPNERALNPVIGAIETAGKLAQLLVQIGEQVLPGLIANITLDNPGGMDRGGIGHMGNRAFVRTLISGGPIEGDNKPASNSNHAVSVGIDTMSSDES